jgi:hypothetical protein
MPFAAIARPEDGIRPLVGSAACGWRNRKRTVPDIQPKRNIDAEPDSDRVSKRRGAGLTREKLARKGAPHPRC